MASIPPFPLQLSSVIVLTKDVDKRAFFCQQKIISLPLPSKNSYCRLLTLDNQNPLKGKQGFLA